MRATKAFLTLLAYAITAASFCFPAPLVASDYKIVDDNGLAGHFYYQEGATNQRPVIIFGGSGGGFPISSHATEAEFADSLVDKGYAVLFLAYFNDKSINKLPATLKRIPLEYFETAITWVGRQPGVRNDSVAVYGTSRGGELALLLATHYPRISVVIAGVPSAYVWPAPFPITSVFRLQFNPCAPAWTYQGKGIPGYCSWKMLFLANRVIKDEEKVAKRAIPVETMSADVLLLSGKQDNVWPSTEMSERIMQRLDQFDYVRTHKHIAYDTGHNVFRTSWEDVLSFLETNYPAH